MARGVRKSIEQKIMEKEEIVNAVAKRLESEKRELKELLCKKEELELLRMKELIDKTGLNSDEITKILSSYASC